MTDQQDLSQQLLQVTKELAEYKAYLSETQDELQQLQAQLVASKRAVAATAAATNDLRLQLHQVQLLNTKLQEDSNLNAGAQQQLFVAQQQLVEAKQQLATVKELSAAKQLQVQELLQQLEVQEQQHKQQEHVAVQHLTAAKGQTAAAKAEVRELRRAEATATQQLSALAADLEAALSAEKAALADARRARSAEASRSKQLAEAEEQLGKCREQLALAGDIHSQLSRLQSALQEHKRQQHNSQVDAEHSKEQQSALLAELSQYKSMLSEAQEEVTRLEGDSRELQALRRRSSSSSISLQSSSTGACLSGSMLLHTSSTSASILADTGVSHSTKCVGGTQPQQQRVHSMVDDFVGRAGDAAAAAGQSSSLVTQLYIPDMPRRSNSAQGTPSQSAAAPAEAEVVVDLCPSSSTTPTATDAAAVTSPKLGWLASPKLSPRMSPRPGSHRSGNTGCTAGSGASNSRIPSAPACRQQSKEGGNMDQCAAAAATAPMGNAIKLMSATAPAGLLSRCCVATSHQEQQLKSHSCRSSSSVATHPPGAGSHNSGRLGNLKSAAAAAAAAAGSVVQPVECAPLPCQHSLGISSTAADVQNEASSNMGVAPQPAACAVTVSADNTPRRRNSTSSTVAAPVPLAHALLSPRCLWAAGAAASNAAAAPRASEPKAGVAAASACAVTAAAAAIS